MLRRYFIQHITGDPILICFVQFESLRERDDGTLEAEWTPNLDDRQLWDTHGEARAVRDLLGMGVVLPTHRPDAPDPDEDARITAIEHNRHKHRVEPDPTPPPDATPLTDDQLPWWHR